MSGNSSSNSSSHVLPNFQACNLIFITLFAAYIFLVPLFLFILYLGYQQWRKQRFVARSETMSHSDVFTLNMVLMELATILGSCLYCFGSHTSQHGYATAGMYVISSVSPGQALFHLITCLERYLAVVHPVTYLGLKQTWGIRIRNISIGFVWLICIGTLSISGDLIRIVLVFVFFLLAFIVICFCSFSVLSVLLRPGPGQACGNKGQVDQAKQRAFQTIMAITCTLFVRFASSVIYVFSYLQSGASTNEHCVILWSTAWFGFPSSLVLPLLFLHRAGKLSLCKKKHRSS